MSSKMTGMEMIYTKYLKGDPLTVDELRSGAEFFGTTALMLGELGPTFKLACNEARRVSRDLNNYIANQEP